RRHPRESPKGLPGPLEVPGRVLVAVQEEAAGRAEMGTHAQALGHPLATAAAVLAGVLRGDRDDPTPGAGCRGFQDGAERRPAGIAAALGEVAVPHQSGDPQIFERDAVVGAQQTQRRLLVEVAPLPLDRLVRLGEPTHRRAAPMAPLLAAGDAPLRLLEL